MAIEPVNERPIFPQLFRADSQNVSYWSTSMIRQLTTVFQQYGYRLNRTLLAGGLTTNANTLSASGGYVLTENAVGTPVANTPNIAVLHADTSTSDNPLRRGATQIAFVTNGAAPAAYRRARNNDAASLDDWGAWAKIVDEAALTAELADVLRDADRASLGGNLAETDNANTFGPPQEFTTMPTVGGIPVVESGSNANGSWTKYADGRMICEFLDESTVRTTETALGNIFWGGPTTLTFPQPFASRPVVSPACKWTEDGGSVVWGGVRASTATTAQIFVMSHSSGGRGHLGYIARGEWV